MESSYKIIIPEPCAENWNGMTPNTEGKFCGNCQKNVVDFTSKAAAEIQNYFAQNTGKSICGRFENRQLEGITLQIPQQLLYRQVHFHKMFLLALFIAMGTTLFSCADEDGKKQKIDKVEVVKNDAPEEEMITIGMLRPPKADEATHFEHEPPPLPPPAPKIEEVQFVHPTKIEKAKIIQTIPNKPAFSKKGTGEVVRIKDSINHHDN